MISLVVAVSLNRVIGYEGQIPWYLPSDLRHFKDLTINCPVIMGRKTWESLPPKFRPLSKRTNIILSRSRGWSPKTPAVIVCASWPEARDLVRQTEEAFVIGGQSVYEAAWSDARKIFRTVVQVQCLGDAFFPEINPIEWELVEASPMSKGEKDQYSSTFETWRRR